METGGMDLRSGLGHFDLHEESEAGQTQLIVACWLCGSIALTAFGIHQNVGDVVVYRGRSVVTRNFAA